ncbi:MAG: hypothetical protein ACLPWG_22735 [Steroidobacteraceae bacterium]
MRASPIFLILLVTALLPLDRAIADHSAILVVNHGQERIIELYIINQSAQTWGNDLLAGQPLQANQQRSVSISVSCPCRVKAIYDDGSVRYLGTSVGGTVVFNH